MGIILDMYRYPNVDGIAFLSYSYIGRPDNF